MGLLIHLHRDRQIWAAVALDTLDLRLDLYHGVLYFIDYFFGISLYTWNFYVYDDKQTWTLYDSLIHDLLCTPL